MPLHSAQLCYLTNDKYHYIGTPIHIRTKTKKEAYVYANKILKRINGDRKYLRIWGSSPKDKEFLSSPKPSLST